MGESFTHFLVCDLGFLEGSNESCGFIKAVVLETSGVRSASGLVIRFYNSLRAGDFGTLYSCIFPCRSCGGEIFILGNPSIFVGFSDGSGSFLKTIWGEIERVRSKVVMEVVINEGSNLGIVLGNNSP